MSSTSLDIKNVPHRLPNNEMEKIMQSMGWTDGTFIPIANAENKELMALMQRLLEQKEAKSDQSQDLNLRSTNLQRHITNAQHDIGQNSVCVKFVYS